MNFLSPLALLMATLSVPLLLLYFLKVRRRQMRVSSLLLWDPSLRDREASTFFQRLQRDPLLILQILALLALSVALARPAVNVMGQGAKRVAIVIDSSASMKATDVPGSRFIQAQRAALGLLGQLGEGAEVMVIDAGVQPRVLVPFTREHDRVASSIRSMEAHDLPNRLAEGLRTARALVGTDPRAEIHVFTDGSHPAAARAQGNDVRVRWTGTGRRSHNVGITSLAVRRNYFGTYNSQAFFSVGNFSSEQQNLSLRLTLDDEVLSERTLTLGPQVRRAIVVPFSEQRGGVLKLRLDVSDDLDADNVAYAVIPPPRTISVLLVSPGNLFLEKALQTDPQVKLEVRKPDAYPGGMEGFDVVVVDSVSPQKLGNGRFVLVNTVPSDVPLEVLGRLDSPTIMDWDRTHPIMRQVDLAKVTMEDAMRVRPLAAGKTLVEAVGGPLVYALEERDRKALFFGFDLFRSDFPLRVAFPLMLSKGLRWLHPAGLDQSSLQLQAGQPILIPVEHGVTTATVRTPSGRSVRAQVNRGMASFTETDEVGVYAVVTGRGETRVAVNLMNADESDLTPQPLPTFVEGARPESPPVLIQRELWPFFVGLALLLFAVEGFLYWRRQTGGRLGLPRGLGDRWALGLRCLLVAVLLLALTRPTVPRWADRLNVTFLLDASDSVSLAARESAYRFASQAAGAMQPGDQAALVVFGEEAVVDQPLRPTAKIERPQAQVPGRGTNLAQALQLGLATAPAGQANRFVLLTDGRQNQGNALAVAQAAKDAGADIYYVPAPLTFTQEVVVESMVLPQEVKFGEPFQAKVVAWSQAETQGRLSLYRNGEFLGSQVVRLSPGKNVYTYRQSLEQSGIHVYQAALDVDGDTIEENNRAIGTLVVRGRPQVLLAEKDRTQAQALSAALRSQHVDVTVVEADKIPKDMAGLQKYDGLILSNVSSLKMTKKQMENIRDYVREQGGGLIMLGGEESFGLGGYYRTPIEEALPVTMEVKQKIEIPSLAVVLSIDRSGSMAMTTDEKVTKLDIAKEAAHLVVDLLDERNEVGVMSWDTEFIWDSPLRPARDKQTIHHAIATIKAGGGTDGYPALKESYQVLFDRPALLKHVIFLSDGQMTRGDFAGLLRRMAKDKITVSTVAIGKDADVPLMVDVAKWGRGRFYYTEDDSTIPRIFTLETQLASKASLVEQPFKPTVASPAHEAIQEINWKEAPPLGGYVATSMKANADLVLMTHQEDPLLATWRYGLGRSVAFTSDAKAKWGVLWVRWSGFNKFWSQVTRWALRTGTRSDTVATVSRTDNDGEVLVDAIDPKGEFINFLDSQVGVVSPDKTRTVIDLEQIGPGRYRGRFPAGQEGVYLVGMAQRRADQMVGSQLAGLVVPYGREFRDLGVDETFLRELTELTGGGMLADPKDAFLQNRHKSRLSLDIWPWLVGAVAVLLIPEIALRRIGPVGLGRLWARVGRGKGGAGHENADRS
ncbi:MAG TPA: VWA domain-containing protein [Methylomirabilota bacterium]|jgi:Ca-activated chloride channel family protein|nr:VWA domain-containing protein [Methylomirabilota bacterium]